MIILSRFLLKLIKTAIICALPSTLIAQNAVDVQGFWTNDINPSNTTRAIYTNVADKGPLYLCTKIRGDREMLEMLHSGGTPPILSTRHKWFRYVGERPFFEETQKPLNVLETAENKDKKLAEFDLGVEKEGFFELYICSGKLNVRPGWWQVEVVYVDNTPVLCGNDPCVYKILVK